MHSETPKSSKRLSQISIDEVGFGFSQLLIACFSGSFFCLEASILGMFSLLLPELSQKWKSPVMESFVVSLVFFGIFVGNNIFGILADRYGRRSMLTLSTIICLLFSLIASLSVHKSPLLFTLCEFVCGIGCGGGTVAFSYFIEFLPRNSRGIWLLLINITWTFGSIFSCLLGYMFLRLNIVNDRSISSYVFFAASPAIITFLLFPFVPESFRYDKLQGNDDKVEETLRWMGKMNCKDIERTKLFFQSSQVHQDSFENHSREKYMETEIHETNNNNNNITIWTVLSTDQQFLFMFVSICIFYVCGNICYYGISLSSPHFFSEENRFLGTTILAISEIPGMIVGAIMTKYLSRKMSQGISFFVSGISILLLMIPDHDDMILQMIFGVFGRSSVMAASCITWILSQESFPTRFRSSGVGFATSLGKITVIISPFLVQMYPGSNALVPKLVFAILALFAALVCYFYPVDTKGKELDFVIQGEKGV